MKELKVKKEGASFKTSQFKKGLNKIKKEIDTIMKGAQKSKKLSISTILVLLVTFVGGSAYGMRFLFDLPTNYMNLIGFLLLIILSILLILDDFNIFNIRKHL